MHFRRTLASVATLLVAALVTRGGAAADGPVAYASLVAGAQAEHGLFTVLRKDGKVYLELKPSQLDHDFVQTIVPASGIGGHFVVAGNTDHLPAELVRFERAGDQVAIVWPNPAFVAPGSPAASAAIARNFARSIVGLAPVAAVDAATGDVVIDAAPFLADQLDLKNVLAQGLHGAKGEPYALAPERSYFGKVRAFPSNVVIEARQAWASEKQTVDDTPADARSLQMNVVYNIAEPPGHADYVPRYADDRVGIYDDVYLSFDRDDVLSRKLRYIVRWDLKASDPSKPFSPATHPMVFTMSDEVPPQHRAAIRAAVLKWNDAFLRIGISDAVQVQDQPHTPDFDPDDIRYNMLRWVTEANASFGADSQTLYDPRTGEEFRTGILISADVPHFTKTEWTYVVDPARHGRSTDPMPQSFMDDAWASTILHETGHNLGMQHNFIGSRAYTGAQLRDPAFTAANGVASTVMEYAPLNVWPRPMGQGSYHQTVLGPYDYYAMHWAYAPVPGAATPDAELPTLRSWASAWSDPRYRYASDEDVSWRNGHAADPRVEQGILTNDPIAWCGTTFSLARQLIANLATVEPGAGDAYESETDAFATFGEGVHACAMLPTHYIGGQYLSRAHRGDPHAQPPVVPVPRAEQRRAFDLLDRDVFASSAWAVPASLLQHLGTSEWAGYGYVGYEGYGNLPEWAYHPAERHDVPYAENVAALQREAIAQMFEPLVLARIAAAADETTSGAPMRLTDLFAWMRASVFGELASGGAIDPMRRALQASYLDTLVTLVRAPAAGTPGDASALARMELAALDAQAARAERPALDAQTRAHLAMLHARASAALHDPMPAPAAPVKGDM